MSDLEIRLQQIYTMLQGQIMDDQHPLGQIFRKIGDLQGRVESDQVSNADQATLGEYQKQLEALDLDAETKSELNTALRNASAENTPAASAASTGLNEQILSDLMNQLSHVQSVIMDRNVDPAAALAVIRPFYGDVSSIVQRVAGSLNLNGNSILSSLQSMIRNQGF